ncbi:MAG TPA: hypothetical protein VK871_00045 [Candidatus Limnocylindrales bacterium]|nr:hypothetical protein [Candidatus Limnocylindrales bacterium]
MSQRSMPHDRHDPLLVASFAAGDLVGTERDLAASFVDACADCRAIHDDLLSIARATAALPAAARPRDFRISPEQAARLRPKGWRGLVAAFASPRLALTRQLGVGLTTLGLAGLLVSALPSFPLGMASSAGAPPAAERVSTDTNTGPSDGVTAVGAGPSAAPASGQPFRGEDGLPAQSPAASIGVLAPAASDAAAGVNDPGKLQSYGVVDGEAQPGGALAGDDGGPQRDLASDAQPTSFLMVGSAIVLAAGIALLVVRRVASRIVSG